MQTAGRRSRCLTVLAALIVTVPALGTQEAFRRR